MIIGGGLMKALVFDKILQIRDVDRPEVGEGEALVKVRMAGICNTDAEITMGYMGFTGIPGHEFVKTFRRLPLTYWKTIKI